MANVKKTINMRLCLKCGICVGICPYKSIKYDNGKICINDRKCKNCGICKKYCPGIPEGKECEKQIQERMQGETLKAYVGRTKNLEILKQSVSGGVATEIIESLLKEGIYDFAIGVSQRQRNTNNIMQIYDEEHNEKMPKSVYSMPSFHNVISYISANPQKRGILIATGCVLSSMKKYIQNSPELDIQNYLLLGLFCDCTLNNNIEKYFYNYVVVKNDEIEGFEYRTKDRGGWPGNVKLYTRHNEVIIPREERTQIVKYFKNRRCIYCLDHMNVNADISLGDNYTNTHDDKLGTSSIIIRTGKGMSVIKKIYDKLLLYEVPYQKICDSQNLSSKITNYKYSILLQEEKGIVINRFNKHQVEQISNLEKKNYNTELRRLTIGEKYGYIPGLIKVYFLIKGESSIFNRFLAHRDLSKERKK